MTWGRALPILAICVVFDALRFLFEQFWIIGPALAAAYCANKTSDVALIGGLLAKGCVAGAGAVGFFAGPALTVFGIVMAMAVGLFGWLTIGLILVRLNPRIFKDHAIHSLWLIISLLISEVPLIGSVPALTITTAKMYHTQIKTDSENLKKYQDQNAAALQQERRQQASELMEDRATQQIAQAKAAEELNEEEIPDEVREAA